jgi:hypothetical protein
MQGDMQAICSKQMAANAKTFVQVLCPTGNGLRDQCVGKNREK